MYIPVSTKSCLPLLLARWTCAPGRTWTPDVPPSACHVAAEVVHLISHQNGRVKAMPGLEVLRNFSSFMDVVMNVQLDECIKKSTETWTEHSEINHLVFGLPG